MIISSRIVHFELNKQKIIIIIIIITQEKDIIKLSIKINNIKLL